LTQDVEALGLGASTWSFILDPKGSIEALVRVTRIGHDRITLDTEEGCGDLVRGRLDGLLFRTDVRFSQTAWQGIAWRGTGAAERVVDIPIKGSVPMVGIEAFDVVGPDVTMPPEEELGHPDELERIRIAGGWPAMGKELTGGITPAMTGLVPWTVSFEKGCFTGQELVARTFHRGAAPTQRMVVLAFSSPVTRGASITIDDEQVGTVTSAAESVGLGYLARRVDAPVEAMAGGVSVSIEDARQSFSAGQ
jgi:hypothetical protein